MAETFDAAGFAASLNDPTVVEEDDVFDAEGFGSVLAQRSQLKTSIDQAVTANPDDHANVVRLSERTGLPPDVVEGGGDDIKQRERVNDIGNVVDHDATPALATKMLDLDFAKVAHDDAENLSGFELLLRDAADIGRSAVAGAPKAIGMGLSGLGEINQSVAQSITRGIRGLGLEDVADFLSEPGQLPEFLDPTKILKGPGEQLKGLAASIEPPIERQTLATDIAGGVGQIVGQISAALINPASQVALLFGQGADIQAERAEVSGATPAQKDAAILAGASVTAITEKIGLDLLLNRIPPAIKNGILRNLADVSIAGGIEAVQEITEGIMQNMVEFAFLNSDVEIFEGLEREALAAGGAGGVFRAMVNAAVKGKTIIEDRQRAKQAHINQDVIGAMGESAQASKLRERLPRKYREFVEEVKKNGNVDDVFVNTDKLVELFQSPDGGFLGEVMPELAAKVESAVFATDEFVAIPLEDYQTFIAGTDAHGVLSKDIKFQFDEMSFNEAEEYEADLESSFREEFAEVQREAGEDQASEDISNQVFDRVRTQLQTAGRATAVAGQEALAHKAFARVLQKRYGLSAEQVGALYGGLQIKGELPESIRSRPKGEVDLLLERVRSGKTKTERDLFGRSLVDFVREQGIDINAPEIAEFLDFDIDKDLRPFQKKALREGGRALDDLALAAHEAGFFPEIAAEDRIDISTLIDAVGEGLQGRNRFLEGAVDEAELGRQAVADELAAELDRRDIDINLSNDEIIAQLETQEVSDEGALFQPAGDIQSAAFKNWFKDSKVVDENGGPLVVYHGTARDIEAFSTTGDPLGFDDGAIGAHFGTVSAANDRIGDTSTVDAKIGRAPKPFQIIPTYLAIDNPLRMDDMAARFVSDDGDRLTAQEAEGRGDVLSQSWEDAEEVAEVLLRDGVFDIDQFEEARGDFGEIQRILTELGHDGIVYENVVEGNGEDSYIAFDPTQIKSTLNRGTFDPNDPRISFQRLEGDDAPRGSIQFFPEGASIINLKEAADLSTFMHESAHFFVHVLDQIAPQSPEAQHDLDAMMKFVGATDASQFALVENQEKLARGFEAYLREGKAPSIELQDAFARFKSWLLRVYENLLKLNIELTPEIREVFDRMLATDQEIEAAEQFNKFVVNQTMMDVLSTADGKQLLDSSVKASDTAEEELLKRKIRELEREETKAWKAERAIIREGLKAEVDNRPQYRAIDLLRDKENGLKMARGDVEELRGEEILGQLPKGLVGKEGVHPDIVADMVGLQSGDQLLLLLINAAKNKTERTKIVDDEADAIMNERHGSLNENKRHAVEAANDAVFSDDRAKYIALEAKMLNKLAGETVRKAAQRDVADVGAGTRTGDIEAVAAAKAAVEASGGDIGPVTDLEFQKARAKESVIGRRAQNAGVRQAREALNAPASVVKAQAKQIVASMKMNDALAVGRFTSASQRLGKQAAIAIARRDYAEAAILKQRQLLNHYMAIEGIKLRKETDKDLKYANNFNKRARKFPGIDADYVDKIRTIVDAYQFGAKLSDRKKTVLELRAMNEWIVAKETDDGAILNIPAEILSAHEKTHWRDLTKDEFRGVIDAVKNLEAQGKLKKKLRIGKDKINLQENVDEVVQIMDALPDTGRAIRQAHEQNPSGGDKILGGLAWADAALSKVEFILEKLDGRKTGPMHKLLFQPFADAAAVSADMTKSMTKTIMDAVDGLPKEIRSNLNRKVRVDSMNRTFARSDLIMMALNVGNEGNFGKMLAGSEKDISPGAVPWTEDSVNEALDNLVKEEWELVQLVWDTFEEMFPQVEEIHRREFGVAPERVEARTIDTKFGQFKGGYFPMAYDSSRSAQARDIEAKTALQAMQSEQVKASVNSSMTKGRTGFSAPVSLRLDALPGHLDSTIHFITNYEAVRSARAVLGHPQILEAITNKMGKEYYGSLKDWVGAVASNGRGDVATSPMGKIIEAMRTNATIAIMGVSYTTHVAQLLGYANSVDALSQNDDGTFTPLDGANWLLSGVTQYAQSPGKAVTMVFEKSGEMRNRLENTDRELRHSMKKLQGKRGAWKQMQRFSLIGIGGIQLYAVDMPLWIGGYNKSISEGMSDKEAVNRADSLVRMAQTAGGIKDLAAIQREPGVTKMLTMFYSYFNLLYNLEKQVVGRVKSVKDVPQLAARAALLILVPAIVDELMRQHGPDDDEQDVEGLAKWTALMTLVYAGSSVPLLRDFVGMAGGFGFSLSPVDGLGEGIGRSVKAAAKAIDDGEPMSASGVKAAVSALGFAVGLPATQVNRVIDAIDASNQGFDVGPYDFLTGFQEDR